MNKYIPSYLIKLHARSAMKGKFFKALCTVLIEMLILIGISALLIGVTPGGFDRFRLMSQGTFASLEEQILYQANVMNTFTGIVSLVSVLFAFISVGSSKVFLEIIRRKETKVKNIFSYYSQWYIAMLYPLAVGLFNYLVSQLLTLLQSAGCPEAVVMALTTMVDCTVIFITFKLVFVNFALSDNGCKSIVEAVMVSWKLTDSKTFVNLLALALSFVGWFIISMFTFGLAFLYALPYIEASLATLYDMTRTISVAGEQKEA